MANERGRSNRGPGLRVIVMLSVFYDADMLDEVIDNLLENELDIVALDNGSTDGSYEICRRYERSGRLHLYQWKSTGLDLTAKARRIHGLALRHDPDWLIYSDCDEFFQAAAPDRTVRDVIDSAHREDNNLVQCDRFDFFMTDRDSPDEPSVRRRLRYYSWQGDFNYRAFRSAPGIKGNPSFAHLPLFPANLPYRIHDEKLVLRHYPYRTPAQAEAKLDALVSRFGSDPSKDMKWQARYRRLAADGMCSRPTDASLLTVHDPGHAWRRDPLHRPFVDHQPSRDDLFTSDGQFRNRP